MGYFPIEKRKCSSSEGYSEIFGIFPYRKEKMLLIGRRWIDRATQRVQCGNQLKGEELKGEALKKKFFEGRKEGITGSYECPIDAKEEDSVVQTVSVIPQAIEGRVETEIRRLLDIGFQKRIHLGDRCK